MKQTMNRIDQEIGTRLRAQRKLLGLSQAALGGKVGVSFQQIANYETGLHRISVSRLWLLAKALDIRIGYFFESCGDLDDMQKRASVTQESEGAVTDTRLPSLMQCFNRLGTVEQRAILAMVQSMTTDSGRPRGRNQNEAW